MENFEQFVRSAKVGDLVKLREKIKELNDQELMAFIESLLIVSE